MKSTNPLHILLTTRRVRRAEEIRLIDAEKLKRKLIEGDGDDDDRFTEGYNFAINEIRGYIDSMLTFSVESVDDGWISVKDRLPENDGLYIVCKTVMRHRIVFEAHRKGNAWLSVVTNNQLDYITHWQPLPEPPKGE